MTESTVTRYADLLNVLCDMQVSPVYAARKQVLSDAENAIVFLEEEVNRLTKENARLSGKQKPHPALVSTEFIPDEDTRRNDAAFEASRTMVRVTPAMIAALDRNLAGHAAQSREQLLGRALQAALAYLPAPVPAVPAPSVPEEWREVMAELAADLQAACDAEHPHRDQYPSVMRKYNNDMEIVEKARALLQSATVKDSLMVQADCRTCANRGRINGLSQESYCDSCIYQGRDWRQNHFVDAVRRRCESCAILPCSCK